MTPLSSQQIQAFERLFPAVSHNESMARHTSFRLGGPARLYLVATDEETLEAAICAAQDLSIPWFVFGGGSNMLVHDDGYQGLVIQSALRELSISGDHVHAGAGVITGLVARKSVEAGLTGFEWAIGVPGTIGGAVYGNAGCHGGEIKDTLVSVSVYDPQKQSCVTLTNVECEFGYRESRFKRERLVILSAEFLLRPTDDIQAGKTKMEEITRKRKNTQPLELSSAGCAFKNVDFATDQDLAILRRSVDEIPEGMLTQKRLGAGWLVERAGLLGFQMGGVQVSDKHGNFLVQRGHATAGDVVALVSYIKTKVRDELGIELQEELQYLGF